MRAAVWLLVAALLAGGCGGGDDRPESRSAPQPLPSSTVDLGPTTHVEGADLAVDVPADWEVLDLADYRSGDMHPGTRRLADRLGVDSREDVAELEVMAAPRAAKGAQFTPYLTVELARGERAAEAVRLFRTAAAVGSTVYGRTTTLGEADVATGTLPIGPLDAVVGSVLVQRGDEVVSAVYADLDEEKVLAVLDLVLTTLAARG